MNVTGVPPIDNAGLQLKYLQDNRRNRVTKTNNIFTSIPEDLSQEIFETLAANRFVKIERIISKGHASPQSGWYDQENNEWVIVVQGRARIAFEGEPSVQLGCGDYINIPAHKKHKVVWTDPDTETVWLAVFYKGED